MQRVLGKIEGNPPGPLIVCMAAIHGNEQVGIHAFRNVHSSIINHNIPFKGKILGIVGNVKATQCNRRYIDYDLNRAWTTDNLQRIYQNPHEFAEDEEVKIILDTIKKEENDSYTEKILVDLHSTSSDKGNFIVIPKDTSEHPIIRALHLPTVVGFHKYLQGTLLEFFHQRGYLAFAFEGGMMGTKDVYQLHTSGLWEILEKSGSVTHHDHEVEDHYIRKLQKVSSNLPRRVTVKYRHVISKNDGFRMLPGFHNFQPIHKGQLLAYLRDKEIQSPMDGMIFMPLYQPEGEDGFFIVEETQ